MHLRWHKLAPFLLIAAGVIAYHNSFSGVFVLDDRRMILENELVLRPWPLGDVLFGIRPILNLSLALNYALSGFEVRSYHAVNLLIHLLAGLTLFGIVRRTLEKVVNDGYSSAGLAFAIALLWLVHPLQTQSVTYLIQRAESLMGLFYLLVFYCVLRANDVSKAVWWHWLAVLSFALGMGTKEVIVTAPFVLLIFDRIFLAASWRKVLRKRWALYLGLFMVLGISMTSLLVKYSSWSKPTAGFALQEITPIQYALTQPGVILHYLRLSFWPDPLALDYYWPVADSLKEILIPGFLIALIFGISLRALFFRPPLGFLGIWFFFILAPTSSIMPIADIAFEHRMYLSLISPVALAVIGAHAVLNRFVRSVFWRAVSGIGLLIFISVLLMSLTIRRNEVYQSEIGIWLDTVRKRPLNPRPPNSIGLILVRAGKLQEAAYYFSEAIRLNPKEAGYYSNLANVYRDLKKWDEAIAANREAMRLKPESFGPYNSMGNVLRDMKNFKESESYYRKALQLDPATPQLHNNLGIVLMEQGRLEEARTQFQEALRLKPDFAEGYNNIGLALTKQGKMQEARTFFEQAVRTNPDFQDAKRNLSVVLQSLGEKG